MLTMPIPHGSKCSWLNRIWIPESQRQYVLPHRELVCLEVHKVYGHSLTSHCFLHKQVAFSIWNDSTCHSAQYCRDICTFFFFFLSFSCSSSLSSLSSLSLFDPLLTSIFFDAYIDHNCVFALDR